jgi:hypothetical protein
MRMPLYSLKGLPVATITPAPTVYSKPTPNVVPIAKASTLFTPVKIITPGRRERKRRKREGRKEGREDE